MTCLGVGLWVPSGLEWDPPCFLFLDICFLRHLWEVSSHNFIRCIFYPLLCLSIFWNLWNVILVYLMLSQRPLKLSSIYKIAKVVLLLFLLGGFHYSVFPITCEFFCVTWSAFSPYTVFHFCYCILQLWLVLFVKLFPSFLLKFSLCSCIPFPALVSIFINNTLIFLICYLSLFH